MGGVAIVLFCDLVDSTALLARLGDEQMETLRRAHVADVSGAVAASGGRVVKTLGDGAMASFDSALGALRAAAAIQSAAARLDDENTGLGIAVRVGIAGGEPIADGDDLHGMPVVIASRLCAVAGRGEVLVQELVRELVASRDAVALGDAREYALKGLPRAVRASRLRWRELVLPDGAGKTQARGDPASATRAGPSPIDVPLPRMLSAFAAEPLVGRDREIALLRRATALSVAGTGPRAVLVMGEPGIGKTRHAAAAAAEAYEQGAVVVMARCPPEPVVAFEPWVRAVGELALAGDDAWRDALAQAAGAELATLVPELGVRPAPAAAVDGAGLVAAEGARYRLLRGIGAALACAAADAPLFVVLDDAHWCDPASAQALRHVLESAHVGELVLVATARSGELDRSHPVSRALADLRRTHDLSELRLSGLDAQGLAALVGEHVGHAITPRLATRLQSRTAGNPFFAAELMRDLDERGALRDDATLEATPVPDAVADLVEERLARLDPDTERLLVAAAAIGPSAPLALAASAAQLDSEDATRAVAAAVSERLVDEPAAVRSTIAFPHALVREALGARGGDGARASLHLAIAGVLEQDPDTEPGELARHAGLAVVLTGPAPAIAAHRRAAGAAAERHDHEQAAVHLRDALALVPEEDLEARAPLLLELGLQQLLAADLLGARDAFQAACAAARTTGDAVTLARAALGFAGGDIGFGWETGLYHDATVPLMQEGLDALGEREPRLALRMTFRLVYLLVFSKDYARVHALARRAQELGERLGDDEALVLSRSTAAFARFIRSPDPLDVAEVMQEMLALRGPAERCGRDDLLFRVLVWEVVTLYLLGRPAECDATIEAAAEVAARLGSPRFAWEVDLVRSHRLLDCGERTAGEALLRSAGAKVRLLRPDIHIVIELIGRSLTTWVYDGEAEPLLIACRARAAVAPAAYMSAALASSAAVAGDHDGARRVLAELLSGDDERLRGPDAHVPGTVGHLALAATVVGEVAVVARLQALLERSRPYILQASPMMMLGHLPEWLIGRLELTAGRPEAAIGELRAAVARADAIDLLWMRGWARVDLAIALHRCGETGAARETLAEAQALADRFGLGLIAQQAAIARAELEGRALPPVVAPAERPGALRGLTARTGRRTLAAMVRGLDDAALERRFAAPRRQRALLHAQLRAFRPARGDDFHGIVVYELQPFAIEPPPDAPWRWALELDAPAGRARLLDPAPLDADVTFHIGLAEWVRTIAGIEDPLQAMAAGRCSVEGDVVVAASLDSMFGGR